jgi:hypothetical protein
MRVGGVMVSANVLSCQPFFNPPSFPCKRLVAQCNQSNLRSTPKNEISSTRRDDRGNLQEQFTNQSIRQTPPCLALVQLVRDRSGERDIADDFGAGLSPSVSHYHSKSPLPALRCPIFDINIRRFGC